MCCKEKKREVEVEKNYRRRTKKKAKRRVRNIM